MAGWGDALFEGMEDRRRRDRQARLDALVEEMQRGEMALKRAGEARAQQALDFTQGRAGYLDRAKALSRETVPFPILLGKYPGAKASPFTGTAMTLDELLARHPEEASEPAMPDPAMVPGAAGPRVPTKAEHRASAIEQAYSLFGDEQRRQLQEAFRARAATVGRGRGPYTRDLEIEQREIGKLEAMVRNGEQGYVLGPNNTWQFVNREMDPTGWQTLQTNLQRWKAEAAARRSALDQQFLRRTGASAVGVDPADYYRARAAQGVTEDQILEELRSQGYEIGE